MLVMFVVVDDTSFAVAGKKLCREDSRSTLASEPQSLALGGLNDTAKDF
jgi:hypothetical protein